MLFSIFSGDVVTYTPYIQNGRNLSILLFTCKLAPVASFKGHLLKGQCHRILLNFIREG